MENRRCDARLFNEQRNKDGGLGRMRLLNKGKQGAGADIMATNICSVYHKIPRMFKF